MADRKQFEAMKASILDSIRETNDAITTERRRHGEKMAALEATLRSQQENLATLRAELNDD